MAERTRKHRNRNVPAHPGNSRLPEDGNFASTELLRMTRLRVSTLQRERKRVASTVHNAQLGVFVQASSPENDHRLLSAAIADLNILDRMLLQAQSTQTTLESTARVQRS